MIVPPPLKKGSRIGIVSPSNPVSIEMIEQLKKGVQFLHSIGYETSMGNFVHNGSGKDRAKDLNDFFCNQNIDAIFCTQGGDQIQDILPYLDYESVKSHPKIIMGFSDISVLLNSITYHTDVVTYHGLDVAWGLSVNRGQFTEAVMRGLIDTHQLHIASQKDFEWWREGNGSGKLIGGNLRCYLKLKDSPVINEVNENTIFFWEDVNGTKDDAFTYLDQLAQRGFFNKVKGMVVGYLHNYGNIEQVKDMVLAFTRDYDFPILCTPDFGHRCENTIIPIGMQAIVSSGENSFELVH